MHIDVWALFSVKHASGLPSPSKPWPLLPGLDGKQLCELCDSKHRRLPQQAVCLGG
jgi:hypothetical protein